MATAPPDRLIFKAPKATKRARGGREVAFYATIAPLLPGVPLVPCYAAVPATATAPPRLLLADVSGTHAPIAGPTASWPEAEAMVEALARLHAAGWDDPRLPGLVGERPEAAFAAELGDGEGRYAELAEALGDRFAPEHRRAFERFLVAGPALLLGRAATGRHLTLCHPENHTGNLLLPRHPGGEVMILDWHQYRWWWGAKDIAGLIARCRAPEDRAAARDHLLPRYHERLLAHGVAGYRWDDCRRDYRLAVIDSLHFLLQIRHNPDWLARYFPAAMREYRDLACDELLDGSGL